MPLRIFVSYQRDDIRGGKGRPYDRLRIAFGREQVFTQVEEHEHCGQ